MLNIINPYRFNAPIDLTGLVAHWKMEEAEGTRDDAHGANDLTDNNTVGAVATTGGKAAVFNSAASEYLEITDNASLSMGNIDFTICGWVWLETLVGDRFIAAKGSNFATIAGYEYGLFYSTSANRFRLAVSDGTNQTLASANTFGAGATGRWFFIMAYHDATNDLIGISVNDGTVDTFAHSTGVQDSTGEFRIGSGKGSTYHNGRIDNVGIWKKKLTSGEVTAIYNAGSGKQYSDLTSGEKTSLVAWWNLDEASGTRNDSHGTNHLTDNNTVTQIEGKLVNSAEFFSVSSESLTRADNAALSIGPGVDMTLCGWFNLTSLPNAYRGVITKWNNSATLGEYALYLKANAGGTGTRFMWVIGNGTGTTSAELRADTFGDLTAGVWYFVCCRYNSSNGELSIRINDSSPDTATKTGGILDGANTFRVGVDQASNYFNGRMDSVSIWKRLLTAAEESILYGGGAGKEYPFA